MKSYSGLLLFGILIIVITSVPFVSFAQGITTEAATGTTFSYQGRLVRGGEIANGEFDFQFKLYDDAIAGTQVGTTLNKGDVIVQGGLFTVFLDFGDVFDGDARYLEVAVRKTGSEQAFTTLSPRQPLSPIPYALYARKAGSVTWENNGQIGEAIHVNPQGNVGVGTSSPEADPGLTGPEKPSFTADRFLDLHKPNWVDNDDVQLHVGDLILYSRKAGSSGLEAVSTRGSNGNLTFGAKGIIGFYTQDAPSNFNWRLWIANNGNVGIGTINPQRKLHISDAMRLEPISNPPLNPVSGDFYFDTSQALCIYVDNNWAKIVGSGSCS